MSAMRHHLASAVIAVIVVAVEVWAFHKLMAWAQQAATTLRDPILALSLSAIILTPLIGTGLIWYLERAPPE